MRSSEPFVSMERRIADVKHDIDRISRDRSLAYLGGRPEEAVRYHLSLMDAELRNLDNLISYVATVSPAAARELDSERSETAGRYLDVKARGDPVALQRWVTEDLAPLVNKSEQAAHLVATSLRVRRGRTPKPFGWAAAP